jgi:hypothetical protein
MDVTKPRKIAELFDSGALGALADQARSRRTITERVRVQLPAAEAAELVAAHLEDDGTLVLAMSSAAWAARVRYRSDLLEAVRVRVCVAPPGAGL